MNRPRVGIVGGGLAGIAAALAVADGGAEVTLIERRQSLGGLTSSVRRNGLWFDNGQHVFLRCCTEYLSLLGRLGASDKIYLQPRLDVPVLAPGGRRSAIKRSGLPAPLHLVGALGTYSFLSVRERLLSTRAALGLLRLDPDDDRLDAVSFGDWLRSRGQSDRAVEVLWDLIALPTLNVSAREASLKLAAKVFRVGLLDRADAGDIGWSLVPLADLHGASAMRAMETAGVAVDLGVTVSDVVQGGRGISVVVGDKRLGYDAVVVATPPRAAAALGAYSSAAAVDRLGASPIVNVYLVLDRRVTDLALAACVDSPIQFVFDRTESSGLAAGQCLSISLSAAEAYMARGARDLAQEFLAAVGEIFPAARGARLVDCVVTRERAATFKAAPGTDSLRPAPATKTPGLFLAGAWCDTGWPATMEGAVRSGLGAAEQVLAFLAGPVPGADRELEGAAR
ncbi:MAG: hydroxysqualene dehydroxylase HpnE [Acidimicrobiales bacterium]